MSNTIYHNPVMLAESIEGLAIKPAGVYVDVTFGGGGHSKAILNRLTTGHLLAFDQDADTEEKVGELTNLHTLETKHSFTFIPSNFRYFKKYLRFHQVIEVDGILADLGVSSHQFDTPDRGFTFRDDGRLDMRMDQTASKTAIDVLNTYSEKDLIHILSAYGEIKNARTLVQSIVIFRLKKSLKTNNQLKSIALYHAPKGKEQKYLAQVFQAIRIEVNEELEVLKEFLVQAGEVLKDEGRLVVMSYHSLEDRIIKNFINKGNFKGVDEKDFYGNPIRILKPVNRKPIVATNEEKQNNTRARSAKLRIGKKLLVKGQKI